MLKGKVYCKCLYCLNEKFNVNEKLNVYVYIASIYIFILNYICMHMLRHYGSLKMCKECINI